MSWLRANAAVLLSVTLAVCATDIGHAQTARSGSGPSAQLLQQMQQLASERTSLQAENAKLKKDLEDAHKERDSVKNAQQALDRRAKSSEVSLRDSVSQRAAVDKENAQLKEKMQQLLDKFKETIATLRQVETEATTAKQTLASHDQQMKVCVEHNLALYNLNQEVLNRLEHQSAFTRVAQLEPFTRIKRTQLENLVDEYKTRAEEQRLAPDSAQPAQTASH